MKRREFIIGSSAALAVSSAPLAISRKAMAGATGGVDEKMLQQLVDETARELGIVGAQVALFHRGALHQFTTGKANAERGLAVTPDTLFQIGSTSKVFNAAMIMSLVDEGQLDLDAPVRSWLEDFRLPDEEAAGQISLRQLLSMSAGLDNGPYTTYGRGDDALAQYVAALAEIPVIFPPGTAFGYSNASTCVSGLAAQRVSGENWEDSLQKRILDPLGLAQSASFPEDLLYHPVALGYRYPTGAETAERVPYWGLPRSMAPAGSTLCCSAGDLVRFARMFLDKGKAATGEQVLSEAAVQTMQTPQVTLASRITAQKWCPGPYFKEWDGVGIYGHSGTNTGGSSLLLWSPERDFAIATISNVAAQGYPFADRIFSTVFPQVLGIEKPKTPKPGEVEAVDVDLERYIGQFDAWRSRVVFSIESGELMARSYYDRGDGFDEPSVESALIPLGDDRFLPRNPAMGGNRGWDVAFWGDDGSGRAPYYLDGVFAKRRTG